MPYLTKILSYINTGCSTKWPVHHFNIITSEVKQLGKKYFLCVLLYRFLLNSWCINIFKTKYFFVAWTSWTFNESLDKRVYCAKYNLLLATDKPLLNSWLGFKWKFMAFFYLQAVHYFAFKDVSHCADPR